MGAGGGGELGGAGGVAQRVYTVPAASLQQIKQGSDKGGGEGGLQEDSWV